jgi:hypothetical protein
VCLDEGKFFLFDARTAITESVFYMDQRKEDLFTHERYNDFNVLLGFGDDLLFAVCCVASLQNLRSVPSNLTVVCVFSLHVVQDPFVDACSNIDYNEDSRAFVVSGWTE